MPFRSWERFKRKLLESFQASHEGSALEKFLSIQQTSSVREYVDRFETFAGQLGKEVEDNEELREIKQRLSNGEELAGYSVAQNLLLFKGRLVLPSNSGWSNSGCILVVFKEFHASTVGGHSGAQKTYQRLAREVYWKGMKSEVARRVAKCDVCQRQKYSTLAPGGLLQPLELPTKVWSEISMDFIDGLPRSKGYTVIFVVQVRLPLKHPYIASVACVFLKVVVRLHGVPESIVSDRNHTKAEHRLSPANGLADRDGESLLGDLRCFVADTPRKWVSWLPWAEYWYNTSFHTSTKTTLFRVLYGRDPPHLLYYGSSGTPVGSMDQYLEE
ncbi:hypothetical protein OSB04_019499 [Centaurea solstitialis]|uniref:Integrase zinc-binding domain-containing protein n=1 Tax=Centaurea solstitialis TaxID=347529 RepID=A0AA38T1Z3_9ASTR|nr:hypothetical protein OSB04_019499 [Centaurea solstitialis]